MQLIRRIGLVATALLMGAMASASQRWTPAWTASQWQATGKQQVEVENATLSFTVRVGAGGDQLRLQLSNEYGSPVRIGSASVRIADGKTMPVSFGGSSATTMPALARVASDAVRVAVKPFDVVEIKLYLPDRVSLNTVHGASGAKTLMSAPGDFTATPFEAVRRADNRPLLAGVEVSGEKARPVVIAFGDSITDNTGCALDAVPSCRWADVLGRRLAEAGRPHVVVVQAIAGNRVISRGTGPSALERFDRDVLTLPGVTHVILLEGINDIGGSGRVRQDGVTAPTITPEQLIDGYRALIARAHSRGIKVMGLTILPFKGANYYSEDGEAMRGRVNEWLRTSGEFDAVFDMEKVVANPNDPQQLDPALHRGDYLHPNGQGETRMGEAIPLDWFR